MDFSHFCGVRMVRSDGALGTLINIQASGEEVLFFTVSYDSGESEQYYVNAGQLPLIIRFEDKRVEEKFQNTWDIFSARNNKIRKDISKIQQLDSGKDTTKERREKEYRDLICLLDEFKFEGPVRVEELKNFLLILNSQYLYSRRDVAAKGITFEDKASQEVIGITPEWVKQFVRLYYRFNTPTHFTAQYSEPVGMVLKKELLKESYVFLSGESLGLKNPNSYLKELKAAEESFDWDAIFSTGYLPENNRDYYKRARNAEIVCGKPISIKWLSKIYVKSETTKRIIQSKYDSLLSSVTIIVDRSKFND